MEQYSSTLPQNKSEENRKQEEVYYPNNSTYMPLRILFSMYSYGLHFHSRGHCNSHQLDSQVMDSSYDNKIKNKNGGGNNNNNNSNNNNIIQRQSN
eukprot:998536-Amphidinium_carterae.1